MKDLLEILPGGKLVAIGQGHVEVFGVSFSDLGKLVQRFPELVDQMFSGKIDAATLLVTVPGAVVPLLASGLGRLGDEAVEKRLGQLNAYDQLELAAEVIKATMPDGPGPFLERLKKLGGAIGLDLDRFEALTQNLPQPESKSAEAAKSAKKKAA